MFLFFKRFMHGISNLTKQQDVRDYDTAYYDDHVCEFKTGDILAFSTMEGVSVLDAIYGKIIEVLTGYKVHHVGTLVIIGNRNFVLEAIFPFVRLSLLSTRGEFYHVHIARDEPDHIDNEDFITYALTFLGRAYSLTDAIRSYWTYHISKENGVQCVEITKILLSKFCNTYETKTLVPGEFIEWANTNYKITFVKKRK